MLAIIPARKGSKRLPNKNMMPLLGKPLIHYTLVAAERCMAINQIVVTTDDESVIKYCTSRVAIRKRPKYLATDDATSIDVILDVLDSIVTKQPRVVLLQPTSPLRLAIDIQRAYSQSGFDNLLSVTEVGPNLYKRNGAIYIMEMNEVLQNNVQFNSLYLMPKERSIDIDTMEDFKKAERIMSERNRI